MPFYKNKTDKEYYHEYYIKNRNQLLEKRKIYYKNKILELKPFIYSNDKTIDIIKDEIKIKLEDDINISVLQI